MMEALGYSLIAGLLTGAGALPLIFIRNISHAWKDGLIGFASGVMVAVSFLALLTEALEIGGVFQIIIGLIFGFLVIALIERLVPHLELGELGDATIKVKRRMILIVSAIALHNLPEGFAVGVSFGSEIPGLGFLIFAAIALHNMPEGLIVAAPLKEMGLPGWKILLITAATGLTMPIGTLIGFWMVTWTEAVLVYGLAFAAGAMLYVVSHELLPESHSHGFKKQATTGFMLGVIIIIIIENLLT